ncbi:carbonic anhydrase [Limisphaera sp. 4302-co]|uniref:carbonic anhydrase n=1 Tax=Limisphaera sp. 4302-co TaxID=3400417 RepID=UPI003C1D54CA
MRLVEAIVDANHRALSGDAQAGLRPAEHADSLPVVALSCLDARLNPVLPEVLGIPEEQFLWVRNAGNVVGGPLSSAARSLAMACLLEGAREILVIGHTDCRVARQSVLGLLERFRSLGVSRDLLPDNLLESFGLFASEPQNVHTACEILRKSPLIPPRIPVHGLMVDLETGRLDWLVNGYANLPAVPETIQATVASVRETLGRVGEWMDFRVGSAALSDLPIGRTVADAVDLLEQKLGKLEQAFHTVPDSRGSGTGAPPAAESSTRPDAPSPDPSGADRTIPVPPPVSQWRGKGR